MGTTANRVLAMGLLSLALLGGCADRSRSGNPADDSTITPPSVPTTQSGDAPLAREDLKAGMNTRRPDSMDDVKPSDDTSGADRTAP